MISHDTWRAPELWATHPLILDADIGAAPDCANTVAIAARQPNLRLVLTSDERAGQRARLARHLLDLLGRTDVPVIAGRELDSDTIWTATGLIPDQIPTQDNHVHAAVLNVLSGHNGPVSWIGLGPMSNLADLLSTNPELANRLIVTQAGGGLRYSPTPADRNIALDIPAARTVLSANLQPIIAPATLTVFLLNSETVDTTGYQTLARSPNPISVLLHNQMDQWFDQFTPYIDQHGPMTLALALGADFIDTQPAHVDLDALGRMHTGNHPITRAHYADYTELAGWVAQQLVDIETYADIRYRRQVLRAREADPGWPTRYW